MKIQECVSQECLNTGLHLRLSYYQVPVYITSTEDEDTGHLSLTGIFPDYVIPYVFTSLNITYEFILSEVSSYSTPKTNNTWPGSLGLLQDKVADISVGAHNVDYEKFLDFCPFEHIQRLSFYLLASVGKRELFDFFSFLYQIEHLVWYILLLSMTCVIFSSSLSDWLTDENQTRRTFWSTVSRSFWIYLASVFCEGSPRTMYSRQGQLIQIMWLLSMLVIVNMLYSQFKGILMVKFDDTYLHSVKDLADRPDIVPLLVKNSILADLFRESPLKDYQRVYKNALLNPDDAFIEVAKLIDLDTYQRVKDGTHVLCISDFFTKCMLSNICWTLTGNRKFYFIDEQLSYGDIVFFANWDIPEFLRQKINKRSIFMRECGFIDQWLSYQYKDFGRCQEVTQQEENTFLELKHLGTAFYLCLSLHIMAFAFFGCEIIMKIIKNSPV